ncbi:MAG TPA: 50S ribosomal protein L3 [bacterium]|nr:50S ribosomal protein L3 [bacterium]
MKFILAEKIGMTRIFDENGKSIAVTVVKPFECKIAYLRTQEKDGYQAIAIKASKKNGEKEKEVYVREFRTDIGSFKNGAALKTSQFQEGDLLEVVGTGKGKGFAGTIKRHGFHRGPETHGSNNVREPGSIGGGYPQRVVKGRHMPGRMGGLQVTVKNLKLIAFDGGSMLISGAVPGPRKSIITISSSTENEKSTEDNNE